MKVIFTDVEKEYDALLRIMTLGLDWTWRRRMLSRICHSQAMRILDLACGTGLVTFGLARLIEAGGIIVGVDPSMSMLHIAIQKKHERKSGSMEFVRATGELLPFRNETFQYETVGLALRNFGNKSNVFSEAHRTLTNGGWFLSVDFVVPEIRFFRSLYMFHISNVLPSIGRLVSASWHRTLTYLAKSIQISTAPAEICRMLSKYGFRRTFCEKMTLGIVTLLGGQKQR